LSTARAGGRRRAQAAVQSGQVLQRGPRRGAQGHLDQLEGDLDHLGDGGDHGGGGGGVLLQRRRRLLVPDEPDAQARELRIVSETTTPTRHKWYIVHAYSNFEKKVAESIR